MQNESKNDQIIRKLQRRWIKPTVITLLIIIIPILVFIGINGKTIVTAMTQYKSSVSEATTLIKRKDKTKFFETTPNINDHPVAQTESDLPQKPYLIAFYMQHCPYCEVSHSKIENNRQLLLEKYENSKTPVVYIDIKKPLGQKIARENEINVASTMMLVAAEPEDNQIVLAGTQGAYGEPVANTEDITKIFRDLDKELERYHKHQNQRDRIDNDE